jgi:CHAD domain-containing protein
LRSDLRTFGPVLDQVWVNHIRADLNWMAELVDRLRQEDAVVERVRGHAESPDREAVDELIRLLRSDRHLGATELCEALSSDRYADLVERLHTASLAPPLAAEAGHVRPGSLDRVLTSLVAARWRALRIGLDDLGPAPSDYDLDHVRLLAKRLRHAAEAVEPYVGRPARRTAHSAQALQNCLGALSDAVNASTVIRELAPHPSVTPAVAYVAGHIAGRAEGEAGGARRSWPKRAKKLRRGPAAAWLA